MRTLLLGAGPRLDWTRSFIEELPAPRRVTSQLIVPEGTWTGERLQSLIAEPVDALILVDHVPFAVSDFYKAGTTDGLRNDAQRAIIAYELSRRAACTLVLAPGESERWPAALAGLRQSPIPPSFSAPPPFTPGASLPAGVLIATYLEPLFAAPRRGGGGTAELTLAWPREAFLYGDAPGDPLPALVEVAGRARILAYGPYLLLPSGGWHAKAFLGFSPDIGKMPFILEADTGGVVSRGFFEVDRGGIFSLDLDFEVANPLHPIEMRLISQDSALEGQLSLIEVSLKSIVAT